MTKPLNRPSTVFERPPGNVYTVPDDGGPPLADLSERPAITEKAIPYATADERVEGPSAADLRALGDRLAGVIDVDEVDNSDG